MSLYQKVGEKTRPKKDNYRAITLLSCMHKLFEKKLSHKLDHWFSINEVISPMQFAFQKGCSSKDSVPALNEAIHFYNKRGNNVYVVFLDVAKAFDNV